MNKSQKKLIVIGLSLLGVILIVWYFVNKSKSKSITKGGEVEPTKPEIAPKPETQPKAEGSGDSNTTSSSANTTTTTTTTPTVKPPIRQAGAIKNVATPIPNLSSKPILAPENESGYGYQFTGYRCNCRGSFGELFMGRETIDQIGIRGCDCGNAYYPMFMFAGPYIYPYPIYGRYPHKHKHKPKPTPMPKPIEPIFSPKQSVAIKTTTPPKPMAVNQAGVVSQPIAVAGGMSTPKPMPNVMVAPRPMTSPIGMVGGVGMPRPINLASMPRR